jgi:CxxC-x17-CxxC domain-containing protein
MEYTDKILTCSDCGNSFTFTASEQEFFASKGFTNEPGRCPDCRAIRRQRNSYGFGGGAQRQRREMHDAVCASCGKACQVPFEPRNGRPVYCSDCFSQGRR